ncbi:type I methionyl aminopeptidase [Ferroacidibacillus organovorans]|uniref:Methionine aminopeptidase n=1 Tax=Ferroacidibacillus organovorans TaxID=1765683 RepID=A0A1V4EWB5_9BACL|nr:type I methionyl aminopeptidase [Ferroacidibacillus organovorans]OPG17227.1 type I methionyl aminopeptidase [Ferroacidibacillus organovorans]
MVILKSQSQIEKMAKAGKILAACHKELAKRIAPGVTTLEIDRFVEGYLAKNECTAEQKGYNGYPFATCASVNDVICHGFPSRASLKNGDLVTIDMVVNHKGWLADSAWTYEVGTVAPEVHLLISVTKEALYIGIENAVIGNRLGDIGFAIQSHAEAQGFSVVRDYTGHGIGQKMHESPTVLHYGEPGKGLRLKEGMVITIEPMINVGTYKAKTDADGWTVRTVDGSLSAQFEHTVAITSEGPMILTEQ